MTDRPRNTDTGDTSIETIEIPDSLNSQLVAYEGGELRNVIAAEARAQVTTTAVTTPKESSENESFLNTYRQEYNTLPDDIKSRTTWEVIQTRLLENDSEKLKKATDMQGKGQLVGIDKEGKALFKDKGTEPVMYGFDNDDNLMRIYDRKADEMKKVKKWANYFEIHSQVVKDGYELFADDGNFGLSDEMKQVQDHTKAPFIASEDKKEWRASWLESGVQPGFARDVYFNPGGRVSVNDRYPENRFDDRGVVRLLRV